MAPYALTSSMDGVSNSDGYTNSYGSTAAMAPGEMGSTARSQDAAADSIAAPSVEPPSQAAEHAAVLALAASIPITHAPAIASAAASKQQIVKSHAAVLETLSSAANATGMSRFYGTAGSKLLEEIAAIISQAGLVGLLHTAAPAAGEIAIIMDSYYCSVHIT